MNSSPWLVGASAVGRQSGPPRSPARARCSPPGAPAWFFLHCAPRSPARTRCSPHSAPRPVLLPGAPRTVLPAAPPRPSSPRTVLPARAWCSPPSAPTPVPGSWGGGRSTLLVLVLASGGHPREWMPWLLPAPGWGTAGKRLSLPHLPGEAPHWLTSAPCSRSAMCMALTQQRAAGWGGGPRCSPSPRTCRAVLVTVERALGL